MQYLPMSSRDLREIAIDPKRWTDRKAAKRPAQKRKTAYVFGPAGVIVRITRPQEGRQMMTFLLMIGSLLLAVVLGVFVAAGLLSIFAKEDTF